MRAEFVGRFVIGLAAALAALTLSACGSETANKSAAPAPEREKGSVLLGATQDLPDWLFILRTTDGGTIHFNQRAITRADGFADIWLQVRYGRPQLWEYETETTETAIRYELERIHYRFDCAQKKFMIVERQILGANETVIGTQEPMQIWREVTSLGAAPHAMPIACQGA
jgi:hypothetical protein